jgi:glycosyltransferase involved in cell wall biosynthesis
MNSNKVLIVTYYWPPAGGPGVQRWLKFTKYLVQKGYEVHVYVPENPTYPVRDENLLQEVPKQAIIVRYPIREPYNLAGFLGKKKIKTISAGHVPSEQKQGIKDRILLWVRGNMFIPDARIFWVNPSVRFLTKYVKQNHIPAVITTGPPHSLHLIGEKLKRKIQVNWIADFRDPWTTIEYHDQLKLSKPAQKRHLAFEQKVLQAADEIVVTSPSTQEDFQLMTQQPVHLITNGFDTEVQHSDILDSKFSLAHIGSLLPSRNPEVLWHAIQRCVHEIPGFSDDLHIKLIGLVSDEVRESIAKNGLEEHAEYLGYLSHEEVIVHQSVSQVLLLIEADNALKKCILPGKIFEYMSAGRPIMAFGVPQSDIQQILLETRAGAYFTYESEEIVFKHICALYADYKNGHLQSTAIGIKGFHRSKLTDKLISILEKLSFK